MASTLTFTATDKSGTTTTATVTFTDADTLRIIAAYHTILEANPTGAVTPQTDPQIVANIMNRIIANIEGDTQTVEYTAAVAKVAPSPTIKPSSSVA